MADADHPAPALDDLPDEGEAEPAAGARHRGLGGHPVREDLLPHVVRDTRPRVTDPDQQVGLGGDQGQLDLARRRSLRGRVDGVVDEVARHGQHPGDVADVLLHAAVRHDPQPDVALAGQRHLGEDEGGELRLADRVDQLVGELAAGGGHVGHELDRLARVPELDQPDQGVQPVRELVGLRPQRLGQPDGLVQLALEALGFGAVLERDHPADVLAVAPDRHPVGRQDAVLVQDQQVAARRLAGHHVGDPAGREHLPDRSAKEVGRQGEQRSGGIVREQHPAALVVAEHGFPDAVQHRLAFLQQGGDLAELQAERLPLQPPGQRQRRQHADREHAQQVQRQRRQRAAQLPGDGGVREADRDLADQLPAVPHRHLADRLPAERAVLDARPRDAGAERLSGLRLGVRVVDGLADQRRLRMAQPDAALVDHDDEKRVCLLYHLSGELLSGAAGMAFVDQAHHARIDRERLRDRHRPLLVLTRELPPEVQPHHEEARRHGDHQDGDHHDDDLGGQPLAQMAP